MTLVDVSYRPYKQGSSHMIKHYLNVCGHANYSPHGSDIVCSAISTICQVLIAQLEHERDAAPNRIHVHACIADGSARVSVDCYKENARVAALFDMAETGYKLLAQQYPEHVTMV